MANNKPIDKNYLVKQLKNYETEIIDKKYVKQQEGMSLSSNDYTNEEKALVGTIKDKINKTSIVTALDDTVTDEQVASALLARTELDKKIDKTSIATELSNASTDDEVVGALTAYNELQKLESANKEQFATASGDYITVNDSVDGNIVELGVKGNSFQEIYSGKNLFDCNTMFSFGTNNGITVTNNGDGSYTLSGTATGISQMGKGLNHEQTLAFFNHGAGTYTISTQESPSVKASVFQCNLINYNGTDSDYSWQINMGYKTKSYNITQDMLDNKSFTIEFQYFVGKGVTINQTFFPQVEFGSSATEYEAYCGGVPSPNPSYPQAITSVGDDGSLVVKSCGKNIIPFPYYNGSDTRNGITATVNNDDGSITLNGTATNNYFFVLLHRDYNGKGFARQFRGKTVTISGGTASPVLSFAVYDENGNNVTPPNNEMLYDYGSGVTVTIPDNACDMYSYYYFSSGNAVDVTLRPQLEVSNVVTEYEPYKESTSTIPLSEPLRAIGDVKDEITYQDGKWGVLRRTGKYVVDGTENLVLDSAHIADCGISVRMGNYTNILNGISVVSGNIRDMVTDYLGCRELDHVPYYDSSSTIDYGSGIYRTSGNVWLTFGAADIEKMGITKDLDSVKTWLSSHNITVHYPLATPTFTPFADQTLPYLSTYDGVTNISNDDALSAEMTVKYPITDASGVGSRNESRIAELAKDTDDKFDDVNESLSVIGKCKNLLNPTLQTTTMNGVTCTNNGDGTYTINGTASSDVVLALESYKSYTGKEKFRLVGCPNGGGKDKYYLAFRPNNAEENRKDIGSGVTFNDLSTSNKYAVAIIVLNGTTVTNLTFKPMLTENLNATFDDFVPYTGDGDTLTHDVAELKNDVGNTDISSIGDGTVTGAISTMNDSLKQIGNCELIKEVSGSTSYNWNIKDISKYSWLTFSYSNNFITIPYLVFKTVGSCIVKLGSISNNENLKATFTYVSDTNITISASQGSMVRLFGIK